MRAVSERPPAAIAGPSGRRSLPAIVADTAAAGPAPAPSAADAQWQQLADTVAARATRRALAVPGICKAHFLIHGTADAPRLTAEVRVWHGAKFGRAVDAVMESVVPEMERSLGHGFSENQVDFDVTGLRFSRAGVPALSIV